MKAVITMKKANWLAAWSVVIFLLSACLAPNMPTSKTEKDTSATLPKVTFCYSSPSGGQAVAMYAYEMGLFQKHGLDVEFLYIDSGSKAATALIAGDVDFCQLGGAAVINGVLAGEDLVIIGGIVNTYINSLMVTPDIQTAENLKGKAIAISKPGSQSDVVTRLALQQLNLQPDVDVALLAVGEQGARLAAMQTGQIAGTLVSVPETGKAKQMGYQELLNLATLGLPFQATSIATTRHYVAEHRENTENVMKALIEAIAQMKHDKAGVAQVIAKYLLLDTTADAAILNEAYDELVQKYFSKTPYPTVEGIEAELRRIAVETPAAVEFEAMDFVDLTIIEAIEKSGFIAELYQ